MSKTKAHILFIFGDLLGFFLLWSGYVDISKIVQDSSNLIEAISFSNRIGFFIFGIGILLIHVYLICESLRPKFFRKRIRWVDFVFIIFGIVLFAGAIFISIFMQHYVEKAGYQYCRGASGVSALAKELVYTLDEETCRQLTAERREMLSLPPN
jgi:hypothetical protein